MLPFGVRFMLIGGPFGALMFVFMERFGGATREDIGGSGGTELLMGGSAGAGAVALCC